ncbi:MAG: KH domain-containing protein [Coriobacteriales bacterium]|nr:KH domain-containing protein [Coriobacteriales bacterium]
MFGLGSEKAARVRVWVKDEFLRELATAETEEHEAEEPTPEAGHEPAELEEEDLDRIADTAVDSIQTILSTLKLEASIEEYEGDDGEIILDVVGGDLAVLIGRHGKTLDALQAIVYAITNRQVGFRYPVVIDVEGYRHRRREKLEAMAQRTADRAARQHSPVRMRPMNAYERRVVHVALRNDSRVTTSSDGQEPNRQVVVKPR